MRIEQINNNRYLPLKYPNGEIIVFAPTYIALDPMERKILDLDLQVFLDGEEGLIVRSFFELFQQKGISVVSFSLKEDLKIALYNTNPITDSANIVEYQRKRASIAPGSPVAILNTFIKA